MFNNYIYAIAKEMETEFKMTDGISHNLTKGEEREKIITKYLQKYLPLRYGVTSGIVIDCEGNQSKQQDIIIYDQLHCVRLFGEERKDEKQVFVPVENVYAIIEVKSKLTNDEISDVVGKYKSVVALKPREMSLSPAIDFSTPFAHPAGFCFAFTSDGTLMGKAKYLQDIRKQEKGPERHLSGIIILDKGVIQYSKNSNIYEIEANPCSQNVVETFHESKDEGNALLFFTFLLNHVLNSIILKQPDLSQYMLRSPVYKLSTDFASSYDFWDDDTAMVYEGKTIPLKKIMEYLRSLNPASSECFSIFDVLTDDKKASSFFFYAFTLRHMDRELQGIQVTKPTMPPIANALDQAKLDEAILPHERELQQGSFIFSKEDLVPLRCDLLSCYLKTQLSQLPDPFQQLFPILEKQLQDPKSQNDLLVYFINAVREKMNKTSKDGPSRQMTPYDHQPKDSSKENQDQQKHKEEPTSN